MVTRTYEKLSHISQISQEASEDVTKISNITDQLSNSISEISIKALEATNIAVYEVANGSESGLVINEQTQSQSCEIIQQANEISSQGDEF